VSGIVVVGEAPARLNGDHVRTRGRVLKLSGLETWEELLDKVGWLNLIDRWPGHTGRGAEFPAGQARGAAVRLWADLPEGARIVLLGRRVEAAFGIRPGGDYFAWRTVAKDGRERSIVTVPHPSGTSRWWSDPANVEQAAQFWSGLVREDV